MDNLTLLIVGAVLFFLVLLAFAVFRFASKDKGDEGVPQEKPEVRPASHKSAPPASARFRETEESMLSLNQYARLEIRLTEEETARIEEVIDSGFRVIASVERKFAESAMTTEICRLLSHWLPDHVKRYASLSDATRKSSAEMFDKALSDMRDELHEFERIADQGSEVEYLANLDMIQMKYGKGA
ncbi:MAG: hypothetical protein QMC36_04365 [Patescibacteria group bacterium]